VAQYFVAQEFVPQESPLCSRGQPLEQWFVMISL
jgi:hypothetical protein